MNFGQKLLATFGYGPLSNVGPYPDTPPASESRSEVQSDCNAVEIRAEEISWAALRGGVDMGGVIVNPRLAENLSTVLACISAISTGVASLPAYVYRVEGNSRSIDDGHPVARLIAGGPNEHQTWADFIEFMMAQVLLRGNGISEIQTDGRGAVIGLQPIPWEWTAVQMLPSGRLVYDVVSIETIYGGTARPRRLLQDEVLHLRDRSDDGLIGRSRLQRAAAVVSAGVAMQDMQTSFFDKGLAPSGAVELPEAIRLTPEQKEAARSTLRQTFGGPSRAGRVLILDQGAKWKQVSLSPEDAEFLASRRFSTEELARLFSVPPPVIGDLSNSTFTNSETVIRWFAQTTLSYWIKKFEAEFQRSVFGNSSRRLEIDLSGLLRGAPAERWAAWKIAVDGGILTPDEVRLEEGFGPRLAPAQ